MSANVSRHRFASRPVDPERWIKTSDVSPRDAKADICTARLTVDITPELRGRIKIAAFRRGLTMSDLLRDLLMREFPEAAGEGP